MKNLNLAPQRAMAVEDIHLCGVSMLIPYTPESRVLAHLSTDKMVYKPLDVMFVEVHYVDSVTKRPYVMTTEIEPRDSDKLVPEVRYQYSYYA